jgi:hypothetical protein
MFKRANPWLRTEPGFVLDGTQLLQRDKRRGHACTGLASIRSKQYLLPKGKVSTIHLQTELAWWDSNRAINITSPYTNQVRCPHLGEHRIWAEVTFRHERSITTALQTPHHDRNHIVTTMKRSMALMYLLLMVIPKKLHYMQNWRPERKLVGIILHDGP